MAALEPTSPKEFLQQATHIIVAVVDDEGKPWAVPLGLKSYKHSTFQWFSAVDTVHSRAIARNPEVAVTAYMADPTYGVCARAHAKKQLTLPGGFALYSAEIYEAWYNTGKRIKTNIDVKDL